MTEKPQNTLSAEDLIAIRPLALRNKIIAAMEACADKVAITRSLHDQPDMLTPTIFEVRDGKQVTALIYQGKNFNETSL